MADQQNKQQRYSLRSQRQTDREAVAEARRGKTKQAAAKNNESGNIYSF